MKKRIKLNEKQLKRIIEKGVKTTLKKLTLLNEFGIDVNRDTRSVRYTDEHQKNLDTSLENNPTETIENIYGFDVHKYSIFQRKRSEERGIGDGNPALYALKGEKGWVLENEDEFMEQFIKVLDKFIETINPTHIIVPIPSTNELNAKIVSILRNRLDDIIICRPLRKITTTEVWDRCDDGKAFFDQYWRSKGEDLNEKYRELSDILEVLDKTNDGIFSYHYVSDMEMRKSIINTLIAVPEEYMKYNNNINGGDILLIDDSITRGQSIRDAIYAIKQLYEPKTISVLTMFSDLK